MSERGLKMQMSDFVAAAQGAWAWWSGELKALLPERLRAFLASGVSVLAIDLEGDAVVLRRFSAGQVAQVGVLTRADFDAARLRAALAPYLEKPWYLRDAFALRLSPSLVLRRNLSLPLAARRNIETLLDMELERQSPLDRGEVYHDYRIAGADRASRRIDVVWHIVKRASIAPALEVCRRAGIDLSVISVIGEDTPPNGGDLPVSSRAALYLKAREWLVTGLLTLALALVLVVTTGAYLRNQVAIDAFTTQVDEARIAAQTALVLQHRADVVLKREARVVSERQRQSVARLLAETTRLLPDGSWLTEFGYRDGEVHIHGYSNAAPSLIAVFDSSPLFSSAEFRAPLVQAQAPGQEEFDLAFKVREDTR